MAKYTVSAGDSMASIAKDNGYLWKTLWEHPDNAGLRSKRSGPNQLVEGDVVFLPDKSAKEVDKPTDGKHRFKRKGEPTRLKLQLTEMGEPRKHEKYTLTFGDQVIHASTDDQGRIDQPIPGETRTATLHLGGGSEAYEIGIGELDPVDQISGVQHRLANLGFPCDGEDGELGDATRAALKRFQAANGLQESGEADGPTRAKLSELHV